MSPVFSSLLLLADAAAPAPAAAPAGSGPSMLMQLLPMVLIIGAMWFLVIAPQQKKAKEHRKMVDTLSTGDEVITSGGIFGTIAQRKEDRFVVKIADNTKVEIERSAITSVIKKSS